LWVTDAKARLRAGGGGDAAQWRRYWHSWYQKECCHNNDYRPVPRAELSLHDKDVVWGKHLYFSESMFRESKKWQLRRLRQGRARR
jgi:hypothetical protein